MSDPPLSVVGGRASSLCITACALLSHGFSMKNFNHHHHNRLSLALNKRGTDGVVILAFLPPPRVAQLPVQPTAYAGVNLNGNRRNRGLSTTLLLYTCVCLGHSNAVRNTQCYCICTDYMSWNHYPQRECKARRMMTIKSQSSCVVRIVVDKQTPSTT